MGNSNASHLNFYYCQTCKEIPNILIDHLLMVNITCSCTEKEESKEPIRMTIKSFLDSIETQKERPNCCKSSRHSKPEVAEGYCTRCFCWLCIHCIKKHNLGHPNHRIIISDGMIMSALCEEVNCKKKKKSKFFCITCNIHLCKYCKPTHSEAKHKIADLKKLFSQEEYSKNEERIKNVKNKMDYNYLRKKAQLTCKKEKIEEDDEELISQIELEEKILEERRQEDFLIIDFFKTLLATYIHTKDVLNYRVINNILANHIDEIDYGRLLNKKEKTSEVKERETENDSIWNFIKAQYETKKGDNKLLHSNELNGDNSTMFFDEVEVPFCNSFEEDEDEATHFVKIVINSKESITNLKRLFYSCDRLTHLDFSGFDLSRITSMEEMLAFCTNLKEVDFSCSKTDEVVTMRRTFYNCKNLQNLNVSDFNTNKVTDMECMFGYCQSLNSLNLEKFNISNVSDISYMFYNCNKLQELSLNSWNPKKGAKVEGIFKGCTALNPENLRDFCYKSGAEI